MKMSKDLNATTTVETLGLDSGSDLDNIHRKHLIMNNDYFSFGI